MSLGQKTLGILLLTVVGLTGSLHVASRILLLRKFEALEQRETRKAVERAQNAVSDAIQTLSASTADYGAWDKTYAFLEHATSLESMQQEFKNEAMQGLHVNSVLIMDADARVVFFKTFDSSLKLEKDSSELKELLASDPWVKHVGSSSTPASGILVIFGRPTLIAASPILTSERKGPSRGVLVMTRDLDAQFIENLAADTRSSTSLSLLSNLELDPDSQRAISALRSDAGTISLQVRSSEIVSGYKLLYDIRGNPILILQTQLPRDLFQEELD